MNYKIKIFAFLLVLNSVVALSQNTEEKSLHQKAESKEVIEKAEKFYEEKKFKKAIDYYTVALSYNENLLDIYKKRAGTFFQIGDYENAIKDFTKVIEFNPENKSTIYFMRGLSKTLLTTEDKDGACQDIKKAIELGYDASNLNGLDEYCSIKK
jgi:tetratricopeptide (TPR) repeat protein